MDKFVIIKTIFNKFISKIKDKNKSKYISFTNDIYIRLYNSYRELIHLEYFIINTIKFL